jgi:hypothetical protein
MHIPHVSHWSEAVRDMKGIGHGKNSFSNAMTRADHKVISFEIKLFDGCGEQREVISIIFQSHGKFLNKRGLDIHPLNDRRELILDIDKRIEICIGVKFTEDFEALFPSSHTSKPVMNQRDLQ